MDQELKNRLDKIDENILRLHKLLLEIDSNQAENFSKLQKDILEQIENIKKKLN